MKPYYQENGIAIYHGDCREVLPGLSSESLITDPVWPNSIFPEVENPEQLLAEALQAARVRRVVVHLGGDSDPRFLRAVPDKYPFIRFCLHPTTRHLRGDVYHYDPDTVANGRRFGFAWFSPDCMHHSKAKGGVPIQ